MEYMQKRTVIPLFIFICCVAIYIFVVIYMQSQNNYTQIIISPVMYFLREEKINYCTNKFETVARRNRRKVLSYSFYGSWVRESLWHQRIDILASQANESQFFHYWTIRIYHDDRLKVKVQETLLSKHDNLVFCNIHNIPGRGDLSDIASMEWRFIPIGDPAVDVMCSRDIDTPLVRRESEALQQWLDSGYYFHQLRDHPQHNLVIMGGLWCARNEQNRTRSDHIFNLILTRHNRKINNKEPPKMSDQYFLKDHVWPIVKGDIMQHDSFHCQDKRFKRAGGITPYPYPRPNNKSAFMGCKLNCNSRTLPRCPVACRPPEHKDWINC